jgi:hypothetical protein
LGKMLSKNSCPLQYSEVFPLFFSSSLMTSDLTCRCLIHFELIFVTDGRQGSSFSLLHEDNQFSLHHLIFSLIHVINTFVKTQLVSRLYFLSYVCFYGNTRLL